jgi:hypothetical protein
MFESIGDMFLLDLVFLFVPADDNFCTWNSIFIGRILIVLWFEYEEVFLLLMWIKLVFRCVKLISWIQFTLRCRQ